MPTTNEELLNFSEQRLRSFRVDSFCAHAGEVVNVAFAENSFEASYAVDELLSFFRQAPPSLVHAPGGIVVANIARRRRDVREWFHRQTTSEWLANETGFALEEARSLVSGAGLDPDIAMNSQAGNPCTLLGILAALTTEAQVLCFCTSGWCDPMGVQQVLNLIFARLGNRAAVYVSSPVDWSWPEFQFDTTIAVTREIGTSQSRVAG